MLVNMHIVCYVLIAICVAAIAAILLSDKGD